LVSSGMNAGGPGAVGRTWPSPRLRSAPGLSGRERSGSRSCRGITAPVRLLTRVSDREEVRQALFAQPNERSAHPPARLLKAARGLIDAQVVHLPQTRPARSARCWTWAITAAPRCRACAGPLRSSCEGNVYESLRRSLVDGRQRSKLPIPPHQAVVVPTTTTMRAITGSITGRLTRTRNRSMTLLGTTLS
jgi:hypothetical protein